MKHIQAIFLCALIIPTIIHSMDLEKTTAWVQTNDGNRCQISRQEIKEMKTLQLLLAHQRDSNSSKKPINAHMVDAQGLQLIRTGLTAPSMSDFDSFYYNLDRTNLDLLINATDTLEVPLLRALCVQKAFPPDIQKQITPAVINLITSKDMQLNVKKPFLLETDCDSNDTFKSIAWSNNKKFLILSTSQPHNCMLWNLAKDYKVWSANHIIRKPRLMGPVAFNSNGKELAMTYEKKGKCFLAIIGAPSLMCIKQIYPQQFTELPNSIAWSPDNTKIALGFSEQEYEEPNFYLLDALTTNIITTQQMDSISQLLFCPDNKTIIASCNRNIHVWDITCPKQIKTFCVPYETDFLINVKIALNAQGTKIIIGYLCAEKPILLDLITGNTKTDLSPQSSDCVAWSPDGTKIAAAGFAQKKPSITIWDALTGHELVRFHKDKTYAIAFSPTSKKIVAAGCIYQQPAIYTLLTDEEEKNIAQLKNLDIAQLWVTYKMICRIRNNTLAQMFKLEEDLLNSKKHH